MAESTHQVSRAHQDPCPAVQLREDILGQVWTGPGRWQEAEIGVGEAIPQEIVGTGGCVI